MIAHRFTCGERKFGKTSESLKMLWNWLESTKKTNAYRPVSILLKISNFYKNIICNQFYWYFNDKNFPSQCGFCWGYSSEHSFFVITEKFKDSIDKGNKFGAFLTDLSKLPRVSPL